MQRAAQQAQAVGQHAGDRAGAVAELHGLAVAVPGGRGDAEVAGGGQPHADEADHPAEERADQERAGPAEGERRLVPLGEVQDDRDDDDQRADLAELGRQVGIGPFAHGRGDLLHLRRALVGLLHLPDQHQGVNQSRDGDHQHKDQRTALDVVELLGRKR